jgi:large subunit ribosomal protein L21
MYAILSHGGRQYRVSAGDRLVVDRLDAEVGSVVALEPVLLTGGDGTTALGKDLDGLRVAVTVVAHRRGEKLRIFKYKAKKRSRKMAGYRSDLTELRVESILAKGAALPSAEAAAQPRSRRRTAGESRGAAAKASVTATPQADEPARADATVASEPRGDVAKPRASAGKASAAPAKPPTAAPSGAKPAAKRASKRGTTASKESGDGA